ncbi:MAG: hypothetical protein CBE47_03745 [Pelagibacteraceae bacterium TMED287]|nr:MAG: hypothetical protein CBE47_03745 [Pelagibacteraceae bacterium TMED287]|tara:strand:- start:1798 stop:2694 length:897 start_codon:yes stop_codon:yes gene_type:complete
MKVVDCITYFDEPLLFEIRLNILDKFVDEFVVSEANFTHSGEQKKINFDISRYKKFKHKIKHLIISEKPKDLFEINDKNKLNNSIYRLNAANRIQFQRNYINEYLKKFSPNDWIIYSDSDEIPNLNKIDLQNCEKKIVIFKQLFFYYKFNLSLTSYDWFGTKACRLKNLKSIDELRNLKPKKYGWWRLDTLFKSDKFINIKIVDEGGWHFTELKTPKEIYLKHKNDEHHDEFDMTGITEADIINMVKNKYIPYDHSIDKKDLKSKWGKKIKVNLTKIDDDKLPNYLIQNKSKYLTWFD